ncbi:MAG: sigma-70 family RNA polymerase sigma factor [Planctomycetota bacterium]|nr:sigma-70 family RNA polymerase sigma factor [Planctomycetota bacterium]
MTDQDPRPGDPSSVALERLADRHGGRLLALGTRFCGSRDEAEDLVQEVLLAAYRGWPEFDGRSSVSTWLYTIAARACTRMHRLRAGQPARQESLDEVLPFGETRMALLPVQAGTPLDEAVGAEARARVEAAIAALPEDQRLPMVLHTLVGFSLAQVGEVLGVKQATVKTRLHRARLALRRALLEALPSQDAVAPNFPRQVCLDLLAAKQETLDRGLEFDFPRGVICERCANVFATLDLTMDLCRELAEGELPGELRRRILAAAAS